ncbi:MAG: neutral/alkaline non-lysosomal ceramidase N-terminal domain-containing protein [Bacteroidota bacterium]
MKKVLIRSLLFICLIITGFLAFLWWQFRDRHPEYEVNLTVIPQSESILHAGFAALPITPQVIDTWQDANKDARYIPEEGDTFDDNNGNGKFDAVWLAGFQNRRPAQGIHDELWARTMVLDDGNFRMAIVSLDCIGLGSDDIIRIRKAVKNTSEVDYVIVSSTHTHEGPDVIGMWGNGDYSSGVKSTYIDYLINQAARSVVEAVDKLRVAELRVAHDLTGAAHLVEDSRPPYVMDAGLMVLQAVDTATKATLGTLVEWSNHPETLWNENLHITSDFPHYVREALEQGVFHQDSLIREGLGGTAVYLTGSIGGLMTTSPSFPIQSIFSDTTYLVPSFEKAEEQGKQLALLALQALDSAEVIQKGGINLRAKSISLPLQNPLFRLGAAIGVLDKGLWGWMKVRSEICVWRLGPMSFLHQPGEIYPEIVNGGVEAPEGADFGISPVERPPLRELMPGAYKFTVGLSNDMVGYIIPKSEWDQKAPFIYEYEEAPYGEINSLGPETAPILYKGLAEMLREIREE